MDLRDCWGPSREKSKFKMNVLGLHEGNQVGAGPGGRARGWDELDVGQDQALNSGPRLSPPAFLWPTRDRLVVLAVSEAESRVKYRIFEQ